MYSAGQDLLSLINEILDLSKVEAGRMDVASEPIMLRDVGEFAERNFAEAARDKGIEFSVEITPSTPVAIETDSNRLKQIMKNLVSNAIKFTESGRVSLNIGPASPSAKYRNPALLRAPAIIAFAVTDTGIGIPKEKQQIIFEAFQQADTSTARRYGGTGLGLTISRELARLLDGEIGLHSELGKGSTFTLYLPVKPIEAIPATGAPEAEPAAEAVETAHPEPRERAQESAGHSEKPLAEKRILLVDDDARNLFSMTTMLESMGAEVVAVDSARSAYDRLRAEPAFDAILLDIMMPGIDGYQAARTIRAMGLEASPPIIAVSAKVMPEDRQRATEAGFQDYLTKPLSAERLISAIKHWADAK
jgi:CheY-like chemotaxis protein